MKKIFSILIFSLFLTGSAYAECTQGNCQNGQGTFIKKGEYQYVGQFKDGKFHGQGTVTFQDGMEYVGEFKNNKIEGQGTFTYPDGAKFSGQFKNGTPVK